MAKVRTGAPSAERVPARNTTRFWAGPAVAAGVTLFLACASDRAPDLSGGDVASGGASSGGSVGGSSGASSSGAFADAQGPASEGGARDVASLDVVARDVASRDVTPRDVAPPDSLALDAPASDSTAFDGPPAPGDASNTACTAPDASAPPRSYDQTVLCDGPVAFWAMSRTSSTESDLTGHNHTGTYRNGSPAAATMPNGDPSASFNGSNQYLTIPSSAALSIPTTGNLTWEGWIRPDVLQFPNDGGGGYVDWMGKCASYSPTCEWEARIYDTTNPEGRCNRLSAYVFNPGAGLGSAADWQPNCGLLVAGHWYHVVGEYTLLGQPANCPSAPSYPGSINIWVNGVPWSQPDHTPTGCMSQYSVVPTANSSPVNIGTMALDTWFQGAIGKVAVYGYLLSQAQITAHFRAMTGQQPTGSCANACTL